MAANPSTSVFTEDDFKPPDRSTSAPPVLSLQAQSLFAFKAAEHLHLFSDIRCEENYYEFYKRYQDQGKPLPPPLESQPFLVDSRNFVQEDDPFERLSAQEQARNPPTSRSSSNPPFSARPPLNLESFTQVEDATNGNTANDAIWTPLPRKMANMVLEDFEDNARDGRHFQGGGHQQGAIQSGHQHGNHHDRHHHGGHHGHHLSNQYQAGHQAGGNQHHGGGYQGHQAGGNQHHGGYQGHQHGGHHSGNNQQHRRDQYYPNDFDAAYSTAGQLVKEDSIQSLWNDNQGFPRQNQYRNGVNGIAAPTPTRNGPPQPSLMSLLNGGAPKMEGHANGEDEVLSKTRPKKNSSPPMPIAPPGPQDQKKVVRPITRPNGVTEIQFPIMKQVPPDTDESEVAARQYTSIEQVIGHIYSLCKDQHGCRFLQKKLEEKDPEVVEMIFTEVYDHMVELMTDPFGNYLCQKLLEFCNDQQRLAIIERVGSDLVKISKNMHGTRAVQKMIEYLTTPAQILLIKKALANHVVTLIQDLNGNHVIQRCLNRLSSHDNQFIYDSVSQAGHCVEVATHRHGCCVLQRCVDHASESQKIQLINEIIANALVLVQDPYGNYVVQYVLDLPFHGLASELARKFLGHIPILSTQKFSSNVIEKCLNVADVPTRALVIQEVIEYDNLLYLLQDPYANYVIQTSLNVSEPAQHARLVEAIRPHLTSLRNTPYGKRIQNKIMKESSRDYYA